MSYVTEMIEKFYSESAEFRESYDEEVALHNARVARREALMSGLGALRRARGVSQKAVAEVLGISQARVSQIEKGRETLSIDHVLNLVAFLDARLVLVGDESATLLTPPLEKTGMMREAVGKRSPEKPTPKRRVRTQPKSEP